MLIHFQWIKFIRSFFNNVRIGQNKQMGSWKDLIKFKYDSYTEARGEPSLLKVSCGLCKHFLMYYQKDGPGPLKRCYLDRTFALDKAREGFFSYEGNHPLKCFSCHQLIGVLISYVKEKRLAFFLIQESFILKEIK